MKKDISKKYRIVTGESTFFKTPKAIVTIPQALTCPSCFVKLEKYYALIPIDKNEKAEIPGAWCRKCDTLYVTESASIREIIKDNPFAKEYTLDGKALWNYTIEKETRERKQREKEEKDLLFKTRINKLLSVPYSSSEVMICVCFDDQSKQDYIIVSNRKDCIDESVIHYSSDIGRELISAAYAEQREKCGKLKGQDYYVLDCVPPYLNQKIKPGRIILTKLNIRPGGGYIDSVNGNQNELVDTLLYSLKTQKYEIIPSTFDKNTGECYTDIGLFREYIGKYGRPNLTPDFGHRSLYGRKSFDDLNAESILKGYGYSVSQADGLSYQERWRILEEIVDLEILNVKKVVSLLEFFIMTHPNSQYEEAKRKWEYDKKHIQAYRVNPQRFLIAAL